MNRLRTAILLIALPLIVGACASYNAYNKAHAAEQMKNWDEAVVQYEKALQIDPDNLRYKVALQRAKLEASRIHFEKGKSLRTAAAAATGAEQLNLARLAGTELELTVKLDPTNQFAAVELGKVVQLINDANRTLDKNSIEARKKRADITKAQPPQLNPASDQPISLTFPKETPVKDIYRALGNAFGINILFDQAVKNDPISIELKDVTAQQALERVMQAASNFYKVLDEHTIIVIPDNPQARRDYEDLVIRTFYLSNGDAEQVTNVVRTMLEARNVFPLKALNAITIRDTADRVKIAEKIIEANDKARAEVVIDVELLQLDLTREQDIGAYLQGMSQQKLAVLTPTVTTGSGTATATASAPVTINTIRSLNSGSWTFTLPNVEYSFVKSVGDAQTLANPELRISEGEKATLHIGSRVPVPTASFASLGVNTTANGVYSPTVSFQYQDVGIKVAIEPRVHHNREVTLKLTVEVSDIGPKQNIAGQDLPTFITRTIEDTIRLKDGETNFLAGLIQTADQNTDNKTPFLGDIPFLGRLFTENIHSHKRTDLMLTMTPHIIRIPDITEDDMAPMWVGTQNNMTFRGVSPRLESQSATDPFAPSTTDQFAAPTTPAANGPADQGLMPPAPATQPTSLRKPLPNPPQSENTIAPRTPVNEPAKTPAIIATSAVAPTSAVAQAMDDSMDGLSPRIAPQPEKLALTPGIEKAWTIFGMDLDNLSTAKLTMHYDPQALDVTDVVLGSAIKTDPAKPPVVKVDSSSGTITITSPNNSPLVFASGGEVVTLHVRGGLTGDTYLVIDNPDLKNARGQMVASTIAGGHAKVE